MVLPPHNLLICCQIIIINRKMLWREKELLAVLKEGKLNTSEVVKRANMSKGTVLKYLESLKGRGLITCEMIGPTKLWSLVGGVGEGEGENENEGEDASAGGAHLAQSQPQHRDRVVEHIQIDRKIFDMLEEFESVTGKKLEVKIDQDGIHLRTREK